MPASRNPSSGILAAASFLFGTTLTAMCVQSILADADIARRLFSRRMWVEIVTWLGAGRGEISRGEFAVGFAGVWIGTLACGGLAWAVGSGAASLRSQRSIHSIGTDWAFRGWLWWLLPGVWEILRVSATLSETNALLTFLMVSLPLWYSLVAAGWLAELFRVAFPPPQPLETASGEPAELQTSCRRGGLVVVLVLCVLYVTVFVWMNWQMYFALHIPHGDSAMYEEHLWNTWNGKGFRSYLDDGRLFLGEHIQVVHLLLLPLHRIWPSQLMLELCESLALAAGAIPLFWIARRHSGSAHCGVLLAAAFLLYVPMHFLDISIDGKTFRPTCFGVTAMLFALDQLERRRFRTMVVMLLLTLAAKEDFAVMIAGVGIWMVFSPSGKREEDNVQRHRLRWWGIGLALFGAVYLMAVVKFAIPYFRGGDVHYARYFGELGSSPGDIVSKAFSEPMLILGKLFSVRSALYALFLLLPIGFLPLRSPGRLAVGLPWFGMLCLLELTADPAQQGMQMLVPGHHFHAPLIPVLFWSAAAGLGAKSPFRVLKRDRDADSSPFQSATFALTSAICSGFLLGFHPLGLGFWDPGAQSYWKNRYVAGERARQFATVEKLVPKEARVFSTDFIHTRFTHHARSYDYSGYKRKSDEERRQPIPGEKYYIVIDTQSRYSTLKKPSDVPEYCDDPQHWELLRHAAEDYFIVLRRRE